MSATADAVPIRIQEPITSSGSPTRMQGTKALGHPPLLSPGHKQGAGWEVELPGVELASIWELGVLKLRTLASRPCHQVQKSIKS